MITKITLELAVGQFVDVFDYLGKNLGVFIKLAAIIIIMLYLFILGRYLIKPLYRIILIFNLLTISDIFMFVLAVS